MRKVATQGKMRGEDIIGFKFNVTIIVKSMIIVLMNVEVLLTIGKGRTMLKRRIKKNLFYCWHIKEKVRRKIHIILTLKQATICVNLKICLWSFDESKCGHVTFEDIFEIQVKGL